MNTPLRILIVEDDPITVMTIEESLTQEGFIVCGKAGSYEAAVQLMKKESPDLAIIDIRLNNQQDGIATAQDLLKIKPIPLIYLTAQTESSTFERAKKTNPVAFLHKPIRMRELAMQIDLALHNYYEGHIAEMANTSEYLYVPDKQGKYRVHKDSITYIEADRVYVELFLTDVELYRLKKKESKSIVLSVSLGRLLSYLPSNFYRLSRSIVVNLNHLERIETSRVFVGSAEISLPEGAYRKLLERLSVIRSRDRP